jgi:membrane-anchored glycerophosphoryl diester phosphodiesterase (GDPDase)
MEIGAIFTQSYNMLFHNRTLLVLGVIGALLSAVSGLLFGVISSGTQASLQQTAVPYAPGAVIGLVVEVIIIALVIELVSLFIGAAIISAASSGSSADLGESVRKASYRYISLLGASIASSVLAVLALLPGMLIFLIAIALAKSASVAIVLALMVIGGVLLVMPGIYVTIRLSLSLVACVVGGKSAIESVKSSWGITKGNLWPLFAVVLALGIISAIVGGIVSLVNSYAGSFVETLLVWPITIAMVLIYQQITGPAAKQAAPSSKQAAPAAKKAKAQNK